MTQHDEFAELRKARNAAVDADDMDKAVEIAKLIPLPPEVANAFKVGFGADFMRDSGFNLSAAEEKYGSDWLSH